MTRKHLVWPLFATLLAPLSGCPEPANDDDDTVVDDDDDDDDDDGTDCRDEGVCVLTGTITEDMTLTADVAWLLRGGVFIGDDEAPTTLTVEPGTTIYGESSTDGMLVVRRHSQIIADGTAEAPIVMTSSKEEGTRARGDWGGLILNGNAPINSCGDDFEGDVCEAFGEGGTGWYGGDDPADDSGILRYVRVEFAGTLVSPDNELNGIAFQGVGAGTTIDYIQVHMNSDDGIEFFGGTAEAKHVVLTGIGDDNLDWTDGWTGNLQFLVAQQYEDNGDNGIEADNNGDDNNATPRSAPTISNVTLVGVPGGEKSDIGMLIREGTAGELSNMVVVGFGESCLNIDHDATFDQVDSGDLTITNSIVDCATNFADDGEEPQNASDIFTAGAGNEATDPGLEDAFNTATPNFAATAGGAAASGGAAPAGAFFDAVTFRGAVGPDDDWTAGWTTSAAN